MVPARGVRGGFTLLEILMAVAILGTSLVVVVGHVNHGVSMYRIARETVVATSLARAKMDELVNVPPGDSIRVGEDAGNYPEDMRFTWRTVIAEAELPGIPKDQLPGLYRAEVLIEWHTDVHRQIRLVELVTEKPTEEAK